VAQPYSRATPAIGNNPTTFTLNFCIAKHRESQHLLSPETLHGYMHYGRTYPRFTGCLTTRRKGSQTRGTRNLHYRGPANTSRQHKNVPLTHSTSAAHRKDTPTPRPNNTVLRPQTKPLSKHMAPTLRGSHTAAIDQPLPPQRARHRTNARGEPPQASEKTSFITARPTAPWRQDIFKKQAPPAGQNRHWEYLCSTHTFWRARAPMFKHASISVSAANPRAR